MVIPEPFQPHLYSIDLTTEPKLVNEPEPSQPVSDSEFPEDFIIPEDYLSVPDFDLGESPDLQTTSQINDDTAILYSGATITSFQATTMLLSWFAEFPGTSKEAFSRLLVLLHNFILPKENELPMSYKAAVSIIKEYLSPVKEYHACEKDCVLFRESREGNYADLTECPECGEDRYHPDSVIPRKRFKFMSLETRVRRLYSDANVSKLLQSHCNPDFRPPNKIDSIHQSEAWSNWYSSEGLTMTPIRMPQ